MTARKYVPPKWVTVLFARCQDCERQYDLSCDTIMVPEKGAARENLNSFIRFLLDHSGHRMSFKAEQIEETVT